MCPLPDHIWTPDVADYILQMFHILHTLKLFENVLLVLVIKLLVPLLCIEKDSGLYFSGGQYAMSTP